MTSIDSLHACCTLQVLCAPVLVPYGDGSKQSVLLDGQRETAMLKEACGAAKLYAKVLCI